MELSELADEARGRRAVDAVLTPSARAAIAAGAETLEAAAAVQAVYGLTTGVGALRDVEVDDRASQGLRLLRSHAAAFGPELSDEETRATMLVRLHQLAAGSTGVTPALAESLERAVVAGAIPLLRGHGSVGTGDLTVLAQLALALAGEGEWRGTGRPPASVRVRSSEALPFISSNAMTAALGALAQVDLAGLLRASERVAALSFLALRGSPEAYDARVFARRADPHAAAAADRMTALVRGAAPPARVQDPFALRTVPQVHGVAAAALESAREALVAEIDAPAENPYPLAERGAVLHHGGFLTQRLAAAFDAVRESWVAVATLVQARLAALVDPRLTGLPAFLSDGAPGSSGLMILEYVAGDLAADIRLRTMPAALGRTTISIGLEETASHSTHSVRVARELAARLPDLLACELLAATRALRLAPERLPTAGGAAELGRAALDGLAQSGGTTLEDHVLGEELRAAADLVASVAAEGTSSRW
ncbi:aromatic amino acid lyase [Nocardioides sp. CER19]|uniref:aromatic amino acid lyase n=1 Tax=Nocardioides sp. CER19 TaxID=3038538 RepID=UPI00244D406E|nr:aromatic amino acid lyase [Nocardioides sp. CER19]MDH2416287.1 aromatic amino acid lyase [Nocardioides sp. CER19]